MLRSHPRISLPTGESHFIVPIYRNAVAFGDLTQLDNVRNLLQELHRQSADFLETDLHGIRFEIDSLAEELWKEDRNTPQAIIGGLFEKNARGEGKARWGDKTPYYVLHMPKILEWFPAAQFIHLIRDGRDCCLSLFARRHDFGVYNTYHAAKYWQQYVDTGHEQGSMLGPNVYLEIRYEDLLADPRSVMSRICAFLGEEFSESLVNFRKSGQVGKTPLLQQPVQPDNAGKWRTRMTRPQIRIFESAAGDTLARFGYPLETSARRMPLPVRAAFRGHNWFVTNIRRKILLPILQRK